MRLNRSLAIVAAIYSLAACQSGNTETIDKSLMADSTKMPATITPAAPVNNAGIQVSPANSTPFVPTANPVTATGTPVVNNMVPVQSQAPQIVTQPQEVVTAPGMNPPHGQPNHRCDIAVGAPLNSPVAKPAATTTATQPQQTVTMTPPTPVKTVTAPGMNPPHGEPNHRCDIAVGAPLSSPVKKVETSPATPVQKTNDVQVTKVDSAKS